MVLAASRTIDSERYRHLIESTPEALMLGDGAGRVLDANERALDLFRCTVDEMRADPPWALCDASDPRFHEAIRTRAAVGRSDFQYRMVRRDGSVFEARIWSVLFHEGGQQRSWIGVTPVGETEAARNDLLRANAMLSAVIAGAPDGIIVVDDEGDIVHVNEVFLKTWGLDPTVALLPANERRAAAAVLLKDRAQFERELAALEADRDVALHEFIELVDGRVLEMHTHPIAQPGGERIGRIWYYSDVTEALSVRRQKEHVDAVLDAHFSLSTDGLLVVDDDGVLLRASRAFQELEIDGKRWVDLPFEEREEALRSRVKDKDRSRRFVDRWVNNPDERIEEVFELLDGGFREVRSMPLHTASGERLGRQFIYRDVTASENARLALEAANMLLAAQFEHSPHATLVIDNEERVIRVSESFFEATGLPREWVNLPVARRWEMIVATAAEPEEALAFTDRWLTHRDSEAVGTLPMADGRWFEVRTRPLHGEDGTRLGRIFFYTDVTERMAAERELRANEYQVTTLLEALEEGVVLFDAKGAIVRANTAAQRLLGVPPERFNSGTPADLPWAAIREDGTPFPLTESPVHRAIAKGEPVVNTVVGMARPGGETAWLLINSVPMFKPGTKRLAGAAASFIDITERRKLEASAARLRQHESLAVLAGGVAHKLNNLLTSIIGNAWVASRMPGLPSELAESVDDISRAAESAALLVGDLRSFAAPSYALTPGVAVNDCVAAAVSDMPTGRRERIEVHLGAGLPHVSANADGLRRAIINLLENAFDSGSATVSVRTRLVDWESSPGVVFSAAEPARGRWLWIEIEDRGGGIASGNLERAFEPFYTTGFAGSGLGLPSATGIIRQHGGYVGLESTEGEGTTARIFLPVGG